MTTIQIQAVGTVISQRTSPSDDGWDRVSTRIELDPERFDGEALMGLQQFSHVEILFHMHRVHPDKIETRARRPRNNPDWPRVGIFAQRGKNRPNTLGATICRVLRVDGLTLHVEGLDAVDGTPVLDIKPWMTEFAPRGPVVQPPWVAELMKAYW